MRQKTWLFGLVSLLGTSVFLTSCGEDALPGACEVDIEAKADALGAAVEALTMVSATMKADLAGACGAIAGMTVSPMASDQELMTACSAAGDIVADIRAEGMITIVPGGCTVNAMAQLSCEADCSVEGECDPGSVEARCEPGELSVSCEGTCMAEASCEGSATLAVACEGQCNGTCEGECGGTCNGMCMGTCSAMNTDGSCAGTCDGMCMGTCSASCSGECKGSCSVEAGAMVECEGELRCSGMCMGTATAPKCEAELEPPMCMLDADCSAGCEGQASLEAECTPPTVVISGGVDVMVAARVTENLPKILEVVGRAELAANVAGDVVTAAGNLATELGGVPTCAASLGAGFVGNLQAAASASVSVNVSVMASASASGMAGS